MSGHTIWFTGLSGSGKTTIANEVVKTLREKNISVVLLDGDVVRKTLSPNIGYSKKERCEQARRVANVCYLISENNVMSIACGISSASKERQYARSIISNFIEVYLKCPLEVCEKRDAKGYYRLARDGKLKNFVGIDIKYEEPESPDVVLETDKERVEESANKLIRYLEKKQIISESKPLEITSYNALM